MQTFGTVLIVIGIVLGIVLGIGIAIGVIPLFAEGKKKSVGGSPARKNTTGRDSLGRPTSGASDTRSRR
jgi:hypothetical protein